MRLRGSGLLTTLNTIRAEAESPPLAEIARRDPELWRISSESDRIT